MNITLRQNRIPKNTGGLSKKFGKFTVPDFIGERYYSQTARLVAALCALFISFTYVVGQMKGVGVAFSRFLEVDFEWGVVIGVGIVFFYAVSNFCYLK